MSTYNGEKYLNMQIESILRQECDFDLDLIVRDDGSTDSTVDILEEYQRRKKLKWYKGKNLKSARSFIDLLINNPGYDYYAFSDQDDFWMTNKISKEVESIIKCECPAIVFSNGELVDSDLNSIGRNIYRSAPPTNFESVLIGAGVQGCTMLINSMLADIIRDKGMPDVLIMHDSYVARVCLAVGGTLIYDNEPLIKYRQHGNNVIGITTTKMQTLKSRIREICHRDKISIVDQTREIIRLYEDKITSQNLIFMKIVVSYKMNIKSRLSLVFNSKIKYVSKNMAIKMKLKLLLKNR